MSFVGNTLHSALPRTEFPFSAMRCAINLPSVNPLLYFSFEPWSKDLKPLNNKYKCFIYSLVLEAPSAAYSFFEFHNSRMREVSAMVLSGVTRLGGHCSRRACRLSLCRCLL